ncbi:hypothetical protein Smp_161960 [Schistosoma mansoni]|uniref:Replication stress response regulator SDE2 n=1 Tax=Schistosoma mansoni TaxID=6183 RepID=G4V783_SCHMA|nr:hypothetical protein Smp_161960 [Schistosoma mansoni]|eukprot:XP_018647745.1 hypothetical protein Smp_161960 [Schistosoma mansoni]
MALYGAPFPRYVVYTDELRDAYNTDDVYYTYNGRIVNNMGEIPKRALLQVHYRLRGGKGGFGSMLRAIGSQIEKTTNHEMCRDLSGRRMRDVNLEKKLKEWYATADERERKKAEEYVERRRKRQELLKQGLLPEHSFSDREYERQKRKIAYELRGALDSAIESVKKEKKQTEIQSVASSEKQLNTKRTRLWIEEMDKELSSSSSDDEISASSSFDICSSLAKQDDNLPVKDDTEATTDSTGLINSVKTDAIVEDKKELQNACENTSKETVQPLTDQQLREVDTAENLEVFGLDVLKATLMALGLKCGGTLKERASRLFSIKDLSPEQYPVKLLVKNR